jgi:hypothetical protein
VARKGKRNFVVPDRFGVRIFRRRIMRNKTEKGKQAKVKPVSKKGRVFSIIKPISLPAEIVRK